MVLLIRNLNSSESVMATLQRNLGQSFLVVGLLSSWMFRWNYRLLGSFFNFLVEITDLDMAHGLRILDLDMAFLQFLFRFIFHLTFYDRLYLTVIT